MTRLFELTDAVLCSGGAVRTLVELSLAPEHRRGHGALYDGLGYGGIDIDLLRNIIAAESIPHDREGVIVLAVDVSAWLRPDAPTSPQRSFCHVYGRGRGQAQLIPRLAILVRCRARTKPHLVDGGARRGAPAPRRRPDRRDRRPDPGRRRTSAGGRAAPRRRPGHPAGRRRKATTCPGWRSLSPICRCGSWAGCVGTGCCVFRHHRRAAPGALRGTGPSFGSPTRRVGRRWWARPPPRPTATARRWRMRGIDYTPGSPIEGCGPRIRARRRSSRAR
ncbi:hypothetical protein RHRU231_50002 [Rhodococcus ruber]|uniref:Transposase IS701-like DDE domain-containing protein n=1 Tax=Rhodococcus ruber TaxID=1830 RepID=A0A098BMY5_9NOCA|nr:hypothetical protein RHRU231_50002 [Rhodococcus ruber]